MDISESTNFGSFYKLLNKKHNVQALDAILLQLSFVKYVIEVPSIKVAPTCLQTLNDNPELETLNPDPPKRFI